MTIATLYGTFCNALGLLLVHWSIRQKLNDFSSVQLRWSIRALRNRIVDDVSQNDGLFCF